MAEDLRTRLELRLGSSYAIERELGGGGMARVFLATEAALRRPVVLKVLLPELAAGLSGRRFEREIHLAAGLQQANIVPVLTAGEVDGLPWYAMPFVEGLSLRESLERDGRPPLERTVAILRDVARALAYAHERGVVHRDIKPENVLLSGDAAVVTDFGIAKALSAARDPDTGEAAPTTTVTVAGVVMGTPAYMAPEQVAGDTAVDHRADLYSFGCLAYELLTGRPPFTGTSPQALFAEHLMTRPVAVGERCPECPPKLARIVMHCLEKDPTLRPASTRDVLRDLDTVTAPATRFERFRQGLSRRQRAGALLVTAVLLAGMGGLLVRGRDAGAAAPIHSIAVVPFLNLRPDTTGEYLADGMADGLATALGRVEGVRVVSRALSYRYRGERALDAREVGRALSAHYLVQGSVRDAGGQILLSVQLTSAADNSEVWSDSYQGSAADALAMQDSMSRGVVAMLGERLGIGAGAAGLASTPVEETTSRAAYDLYLRGRFLLQRRGPGVGQAVQNFEQAIAEDPMFARAHANLAFALQLLPYFAPVSAAELHDRSVSSAEHALGVDSTLVEAHVALAMAHQHRWEWRDAEAAYRRALALQADEPDLHIQFGRLLFYTGQPREALAQFERARELDPYSAVASAWVGNLLFIDGERERGLAEIQRALEIDSTNPPAMAMAVGALAALNRPEEARAVASRLWASVPEWRIVAARSLASLGDPQPARDLLGALEAADPPPPLLHLRLATLHLVLGDTEAGLTALERATAAREIWPTYITAGDPIFDPLRGDPRFAAIIRRVGLDQRIFTSPSGGRPR